MDLQVLANQAHCGMYPALWELMKDRGCPNWRSEGCTSTLTDAQRWIALLSKQEIELTVIADLSKRYDGSGFFHPFLTTAQASGEIGCFGSELRKLGLYSYEAMKAHAAVLANRLDGNGATAVADELRDIYSIERASAHINQSAT